MRPIATAAAFLCAWMTAAPAVMADGVMSAVSYLPLPAGAAIFVRPLDNSDQNLLLQADFEHALKEKGYTVSADARLVLSFETFDAGGAWTGGGDNRFVELSNNHDQTGVGAPRVHFNLYNSRRGGILNPERKEPTRTVTPSQFRIDVTIDDKTDGKRLWQGWSSADIGPGDPEEVSRTMIPVLVGGLGRTVSQKAIQFE